MGAARARIGLSSAGIAMTPAEFDATTRCDDRFVYELIHCRLIVTGRPSVGESDCNEELGAWLRSYAEAHPLGTILDATLPNLHIFLPESRRLAGRLIWAGLGRLPDIETDVPMIVVDFVSRDKRDFIRDHEVKRSEYMALGVAEYWVIDRFRRTMTVFRRPPAEPAEQVIGESETYRTPLLPGFELPLGRLLGLADRWKGRRRRK
jgi:Uma2 family endonuclease